MTEFQTDKSIPGSYSSRVVTVHHLLLTPVTSFGSFPYEAALWWHCAKNIKRKTLHHPLYNTAPVAYTFLVQFLPLVEEEGFSHDSYHNNTLSTQTLTCTMVLKL